MLPLERLDVDEARRLRGLLFDLDDTLLDEGKLGEAAYSSLFRLREAGLELIAVTGRPAGWGELLARLWPVRGVVTENGAVSVVSERGVLTRLDRVDPSARRVRRMQLASLVAEVQERFPTLAAADDVDARYSDFAFDIGERRHVPREEVERAMAFVRERGAHTVASSVHLHVSFDADDKASGTLRLLRHLGVADATRARVEYAFIGDSANDAACFAGFQTTIGVANLSGRPTVRPRYVTRQARGDGFAEAAALLALRRAGG